MYNLLLAFVVLLFPAQDRDLDLHPWLAKNGDTLEINHYSGETLVAANKKDAWVLNDVSQDLSKVIAELQPLQPVTLWEVESTTKNLSRLKDAINQKKIIGILSRCQAKVIDTAGKDPALWQIEIEDGPQKGYVGWCSFNLDASPQLGRECFIGGINDKDNTIPISFTTIALSVYLKDIEIGNDSEATNLIARHNVALLKQGTRATFVGLSKMIGSETTTGDLFFQCKIDEGPFKGKTVFVKSWSVYPRVQVKRTD